MSRSKYVSVGDTGGLILDGKYDDFVTNAQLESKLGGIENKLVALEQKLTDGSQKVQLSGTRIEEVVWQALAIADTDSRNKVVNTSRMKNWTLIVINSLNKPVRITFRTASGIHGVRIGVWDEEEGEFVFDASDVGIVIPSASPSSVFTCNLTNHPLLKKIQNQNIRLYLQAEESPTSGSITVSLVGEPL